MNPGDKAVLKGQLMALASVLGAVNSQVTSGSSMPIMTPTGPAAAPGLMQMAAGINQHSQVTGEVIKLLSKIVDGL
jgi:hypothetical protein